MLCLGLLFCLFVSHSVWFVLNQISSKNKGTNAIILKFTLAMLIKNNTHLLAHLFPQYFSATVNNTIELCFILFVCHQIYMATV